MHPRFTKKVKSEHAESECPQSPEPASNRAKYNSKRCYYDSFYFMSKKEMIFYKRLKEAKQEGRIRDLVLQPRYQIEINGIKVCTYVADFRFFDVEQDRERVIDVKGFDTPMSKLKRKLVSALYGFSVELA